MYFLHIVSTPANTARSVEPGEAAPPTMGALEAFFLLNTPQLPSETPSPPGSSRCAKAALKGSDNSEDLQVMLPTADSIPESADMGKKHSSFLAFHEELITWKSIL